MHRVVFAPEAEEQLVALYLHIAEAASPEIAGNYTEAIVKQCEGLRSIPPRGTRRNYIRPGLRTIRFRRRVTIAFSAVDEVVTVHGIYYGGQDFEKALDGE